LDIAADGTKVIWADVNNAYRWDAADSIWRKLCTHTSMEGTSSIAIRVWAVAIAPSNSDIMYMLMGDGYLLKSINGGVTWADSNFIHPDLAASYGSDDPYTPNGAYRFANNKLVVDPADPNHVIVGTMTEGAYRSTNGGTSWTQIAAIGVAASGVGCVGIAFDASSGTTSGRTSVLYIPVSGDGVWRSADGGETWSDLSGSGPTSVWVSAQVTSEGVYYCSEGGTAATGPVWRYQSSTWTNIQAITAQAVVTDPNWPGSVSVHSVGTGGKTGRRSMDYGATFLNGDSWSPTYPSGGQNQVATDIPWLATSDTSFMTIGDMRIDPTVSVVKITGNLASGSNTVSNLSSTDGLEVGQWIVGSTIPGKAKIASINVGASTLVFDGTAATGNATGTAITCNYDNLIFAQGIGVWSGNWPVLFKPFTWTSMSNGIEELVANDIVFPATLNPVVASWDRSNFRATGTAAYPSVYGPINGQFCASWSLDTDPNDPLFVATAASWGSTQNWGYTTDGGQTWVEFTAQPVAGNSGGCIAVASPTNMVVNPGQGATVLPKYTTDGGATWTNCTGLPASGWIFAYYLKARPICSDRVTIGTFYAVSSGNGVYQSTDGGINWSKVANTGVIDANGGANVTLRARPDVAGDIWYTSGRFGDGRVDRAPTNQFFYRSTNGGTNWTAVTIANGYGGDLKEIRSFGFGKAATQGGPSTIYFDGWVDGVHGIWRTADLCQTFIQLLPASGYVDDNLDDVACVNGDMNTYGSVGIGFGGSGWAVGKFR
jgi:hypothetical protein